MKKHKKAENIYEKKGEEQMGYKTKPTRQW